MKQFGLLFAAFGGTLAVLLVAFLVIEQLGASGGTTADASASPSSEAVASPTPAATRVPTVRPSPSIDYRPSTRPSQAPTPTPTPTPTPEPGGTPVPTPTPVPPGKVVEIVVPGQAYAGVEIPENGSVTKLAGGGIVMKTTRELSEPMTVTYELPLSKLPSGMKVVRVDAAICGLASGDFWESYGPTGSEPYENEVSLPGPDGCWHYLGGSISDTAAFAIIRTETSFRIDRVVYTVTSG